MTRRDASPASHCLEVATDLRQAYADAGALRRPLDELAAFQPQALAARPMSELIV